MEMSDSHGHRSHQVYQRMGSDVLFVSSTIAQIGIAAQEWEVGNCADVHTPGHHKEGGLSEISTKNGSHSFSTQILDFLNPKGKHCSKVAFFG